MVVCILTLAYAADAPGAPPFKPIATTSSGNSVNLSWEPAAPNGAEVTHYSIEADPAPVAGQSAEFPACTQKEVTGLSHGVTYTFQVRARNAAGYGALSAASKPCTTFGAFERRSR